ncbi:serine aminopeptidase domain-containing protein [Azonexus sp.]|jgi:pimeloyl-ACP methyl ester carboxylesterase|uniref:alpha/beta fold hydrolase n=1 Tax=Azonexus sp. TaxID=1872668 RepID=UPI00282AF96C|nr:alpha/beta hydrolase [Azonexus sp.]MDR1996022.1 lysophospholipase [Azonexus sp.]
MVTLVFLPGLDGTGLLFRDFAASFGPEIETIVVSYPVDAPLGYPELESIVRSHLPQNRPFFLVAESFSGPIGISIAASSPPGLLGLVLCCSFARNPVPVLAPLRPLLGIFPVSSVPTRLLGFFLLGRSSSPAHLGELANCLGLVKPSVLRARARAVLTVDVSASLPRIRVPLLYMRASEDRVVSRSCSEQIASVVPHTQIAEITAPHFLLQTLPSLAASRVASFVETVIHQR